MLVLCGLAGNPGVAADKASDFTQAAPSSLSATSQFAAIIKPAGMG